MNGVKIDKDEENGMIQDNVRTEFLAEEQRERGSHADVDGDRPQWSRKLEYTLTMMGYCIGLGNVWRFPYVCIRNGGGAFLIPYVVCLVGCGLPLFFLEVALGQFVAKGTVHVWSFCPVFTGIGLTMNALSLVGSWYYITPLFWSLIFLAYSFTSPLPWTQCGQSWNTPFCRTLHGGSLEDVVTTNSSDIDGLNATSVSLAWSSTSTNYTSDNSTEIWRNASGSGHSASEEFWKYNVLELSRGLEHMDGFLWKNALALFVSSCVILACIVKGVKTVGKVVYVTAVLPFFLLTVLVIKGATLQGALDGILFYVTPDFSKTQTFSAWIEASLQVFFSLGPAWGGLITMASYSKFNNNCMRDAIFLSFVCEGTSIFAGFAIFSIIGHMAYKLQIPVSEFARSGPGLAFVVYPEAISYLPVPQLWAVLFFLMIFILGLDTQFTTVETCLTAVADLWPRILRKREIKFKVVYCLVLFLLSLPFATRGGMYLFQLVDWYIAAFTVTLTGILECVVVAWIYGAERMLDDIELMIGKRPPYVFAVLWRFPTPVALLSLLVATLLMYTPPTYEGYTYGKNGVIFGWLVASVPFLPIPAYALYKISITNGTLKQRLRIVCSPSSDWRPADPSLRATYNRNSRNTPLCQFRLPCKRGVTIESI